MDATGGLQQPNQLAQLRFAHVAKLPHVALAHALVEWFRRGDATGIDRYSERCLRRIWLAERFSWWMTSITHRFADADAFGRRLQDAELELLFRSESAQRVLAENYVGLPFYR